MNPRSKIIKTIIKAMKALLNAFRESSLLRALISLGVAVDLAFFFYFHGQGLDNGYLLDLKLLITLAIVEVPLLMFSPILYSTIFNESRKHAKEIGEEVGKQFEKVQSKDDGFNKEKHTKELNDKIFKRLATFSIREDKYHNYGLYVKKDDGQDNQSFDSIVYAIGDETVIPINKLPTVYYEWALKHLEHKEYSDKILKPFKQLQEWIKQYNETETGYRNKLEKYIETVLSEPFKDCTIYTKTIRKRLDSEIWVESSNYRFTDLIIDKISRHDAIVPRGYPQEHPYIICETITENQLEQFKTILNNIMVSEEFLQTNTDQNTLLFKKIEPTLKELGSKFQTLSTELGASGSVIQGKCKLCSTF